MTMRPRISLTQPDVPSAWLGCESCYAAGKLVGRWYPVTEIGDVTMEDLHGHPTTHDECVCMDTDGLPTSGEPSQVTAARWGELYEEVSAEQWAPFCAWVRSGSYAEDGENMPSTSDFTERYCGHWDDFDDYAREYIESTGMHSEWPEDAVNFFDWSKWSRELAHGYTVVRREDGGVYVFSDS